MQRKLCFSLMTMCLCSTLGYTMYAARNMPARRASQPLDWAMNLDQPKSARLVTKHQDKQDSPVLADEPATSAGMNAITTGASRDEVLAAFGSPASIDVNNDRWIYPDHVVLFRNDLVIGSIQPDAVEARRAAFANFMNAIDDADAAPATKGRSSSKGSARTRPMNSFTSAAPTYSRTQPTTFNGSTRAGSGYGGFSGYGTNQGNSFGNDYNYYLTRSGPRARSFLSGTSLPRGMAPSAATGNYNNGWRDPISTPYRNQSATPQYRNFR